jgi:adenosine kinase
MSIICTGSVAYDYLMSFPGLFKDHILPDCLDRISLSFLVDSLVRQRGGTAPNIAYTLALLGERPRLLATVGMDFEEYRAWLESVNVDTSLVKVIADVYTASFFANTDQSNAQIASFYTGAMAHAAELSVKNITPKPELVIISPNDPGAMYAYPEQCQEAGINYLYDPSQQIVRMDYDQLRNGTEGAYSLFVNEYEFGLLQKHTGLDARQILKKVNHMVVTLGAQGAEVYAEGEVYRIPIVAPVVIADPTGVGDAFRGGFVRGRRLGLDWQTCGQMGALASTYCLEQRGAQNHQYTPTEFVARYRKNFDDQGRLDLLVK